MYKTVLTKHSQERLKDARFSLEQLVPGEVYHLIHSVVYSSKLRFLGDLQAAFLRYITLSKVY